MRPIRIRFYAFLNQWSVEKWRKASGDYRIHKRKTFLTDHALLRYFERVQGVDVERIREELAEAIQPESHRVGGNGKLVIDGVVYTIRDGLVVSIAKPNPNQAVISGLNKKSEIPRRWSY